MARQGISVQRRALNADSGTCGSGPDGKGCVLNGNPCMSAPGGDAGSSRFRAAGCSGRVAFPRPEDEAFDQIGRAVGAVAQCPARGDGFSRARPHADETAGDKVEPEPFDNLEDGGECHQRTPQRPAKLGTVSLMGISFLVGGRKDRSRGPRAIRIVRVAAEPREAGLLRQVAQGLTVAEPSLILSVRERRGLAVFKLVAVTFDNPCAV